MSAPGSTSTFAVELDADGNHIWSWAHGGTELDTSWSVAVDASGAILLAGYFQGTVDFGGGPMVSAGDNDIYLAKYDTGGNHVWSHRYGSTGDDKPEDVAVDALGQPALAGIFTGTVDFGGGDRTSVQGSDIFLAKYDAAGAHQWSSTFGGIGADRLGGLDIDSSGDVTITGGFATTIDFGGGTYTSIEYNDIYIAKFDAAGDYVWSTRFGGLGEERGEALSFDGSDNMVILGLLESAVDFGGGPLTNPRFFDFDLFVVKFKPDTIILTPEHLARSMVLEQNHPNPFNPSTQIRFSLPSPGHVQLTIYDVAGARVRTLLDTAMAEGSRMVEWDGRDDDGRPVGSGS